MLPSRSATASTAYHEGWGGRKGRLLKRPDAIKGAFNAFSIISPAQALAFVERTMRGCSAKFAARYKRTEGRMPLDDDQFRAIGRISFHFNELELFVNMMVWGS
jgi:hypothetical protein